MSKSITLYGDEVKLDFDSAAHAYRWNGDFIPGVTTILKILDKPALVQWAANCAVEYITNGYVARLEAGEMPDQTSFLSLCQEAKTAHRRLSRAATDIGSSVHTFAESYLADPKTPPPADPQAAKGASALIEWANTHTIEPIHVERMVFSKKHFYAGTVDFFGHIDGELCVLDFKTSSGLYLEMLLQLAAYAVALEEETEQRIDHSWIVRLDKKTGKPTPYYVPLQEKLKKAWLHVRYAYREMQAVDDLLEQVREATKQGERACLTSTTSIHRAAHT